MTVRPYLDYYGAREIIPARQDLSDKARHFRRREALYRHLGLVPAWLSGKNIIEFGPGPGDNAVYTASLAPQSYVFVDGNPKSIEEIHAKIAEGLIRVPSVECVHSDLIDYHDDRRFDLVLCEGIIPGQDRPALYLAHVAQFVAEGGVLVTTTISYTSILADVCRRMMKPVMSRKTKDFDALLQILVDFFEPDLDSLKGMSRLRNDWVLDQILHPWQANTFTLLETLDTLAPDFDIQGTSPHFICDWRWYKSIFGEDSGVNEIARTQYARRSAAFIDYRVDPEKIPPSDGIVLERKCQHAFDVHLAIWHSDDLMQLPVFLEVIDEISQFLAATMPLTAVSLRDYVRGMNGIMNGIRHADFGTFRTLFGRGQQYASFIRRPSG